LEKFRQEYLDVKVRKKYDCMLSYVYVYDVNLNETKNITDIFLTKINPEKYKSFLARPRPINKIFSAKPQLSFIKDNRVKIDSGLSNMAELVKSSNVVVQFLIPGTNFLECIYVDHPTLGILSNSQPTSIVQPYYDFFYETGILHKNFDSIVSFLNSTDINDWWSNVIEQPMYKSFKDKFAKKV
jgi:hypothetical protein